MTDATDKKRVIIFCDTLQTTFKYEGELLYEDEATYTIIDKKEGMIRIPKSCSRLRVLE